MSVDRVEVIDSAVYPLVRDDDELREYMEEPWRSKRFSTPFQIYPTPTGIPPFGEFLEAARPSAARIVGETGVPTRADGEEPGSAEDVVTYEQILRSGLADLPGSDPDVLWRDLVALGVDRAILLPLTRGLQPELDLRNAICAATNEWLVDTWLSKHNTGGRYFGSIRINPDDPDAAVREIDRWAGHPQMVQVAVPLEAHRPYGQRNYRVVWEAAARHGLPVAIRSDAGAGVEFWPTPNGYPRYFIEYNSLYSINFIYHLTSFIAEGVFERLPELKVVFIDGAHDMLLPLLWKMDTSWPEFRQETPWISRRPSAYAGSHVRFCTSRLEGPTQFPAVMEEWLAMSDAENLLMFASHYPHWSCTAAKDVLPDAANDLRDRILRRNAEEFYGLSAPLPA